MNRNLAATLVLGVLLAAMVGCAPGLRSVAPPGSEHYGIGQRAPDGKATGDWELFAKANNSVFARGRYANGLPDGGWTLSDTGGTRNAELNFSGGQLHGEYRLYYTSFTPEASGKLKTIGNARQGILEGAFRRYKTDGTIMVEYSAANEVVTNASIGDLIQAKDQLAADRELLNLLIETIIQTPQRN